MAMDVPLSYKAVFIYAKNYQYVLYQLRRGIQYCTEQNNFHYEL